MKLYYAPGACSLASHIILNELGVTYEAESIDFKTHLTHSGQDFYKINPKGYIPALVLDSGEVLTEGVAILSYLSDLKLAKENTASYKLLETLVFIATEVHKPLGLLFAYKEGPQEIVKGTKEKVAKRFDLLDKDLAGKDFLLGDAFGVADAYLYTVLNWCNYLSIDLSPWKNLTSFVGRVQGRVSVQKTLKQEGLLK